MKRKISSIFGIGLLVCTINPAGAQQTPPTTPSTPPQAEKPDYSKIFKDDAEKNSYAIGMSYGTGIKTSLKKQAPDVEFNIDAIIKGFSAGLKGETTLITETQGREILSELNKELQAKAMARRQAEGEQNKKEGEAFLAENKTKPGVVTLPSGLQYKVLTEGTGEMPKEYDSVEVNYKGTLVNGTEFDGSEKHGSKPSTFPLRGGLIKGWIEGLQLMKTGSKWQLFIPANLAYGERGSGPLIGPNATLIFEIELLSVKAGSPPAPGTGTPLTSDIIRVPSAEQMKKGEQIRTIKPEDAAKEAAAQTNQAKNYP